MPMEKMPSMHMHNKVAPEPGGEKVLSVGDWDKPPRDVKPLARWWWPGGSVEKDKCEAQLKLLAEMCGLRCEKG